VFLTPDTDGTIIDSVDPLARVFGLADGVYVLTAKAALVGDGLATHQVICDLIAGTTVFDTSTVDVPGTGPAGPGAAGISLLAAVTLSGGPTDVVMECTTEVRVCSNDASIACSVDADCGGGTCPPPVSVMATDVQLMAIQVGALTPTISP